MFFFDHEIVQVLLLRKFIAETQTVVKHCLDEVEPAVAPFVLKGATECVPYDILRVQGCPCCRESYYEQYRKFFWVLSIERG